jgi:hypothetical protein
VNKLILVGGVSVGVVALAIVGVIVYTNLTSTKNTDSNVNSNVTATPVNAVVSTKASQQSTTATTSKSVYASYNGVAEDDLGIASTKGDSYHLFMANDASENVVYVIAKLNMAKWQLDGKVPAELEAGLVTYKLDIAKLSAKLDNTDTTVIYYEILEISKITASDEID